ncbi:MAG: hypothetical protein WAO61_08995, partial [Solirubrobacterales bacterium]
MDNSNNSDLGRSGEDKNDRNRRGGNGSLRGDRARRDRDPELLPVGAPIAPPPIVIRPSSPVDLRP